MSPKANQDPRSKRALLEEIEQLRTRLDEAEQTLDAIRSGEVDALVVAGPHGDQVFSLTGSERTYRLIVETMNEAALTVGLDGTILFCNQRFCDLVAAPMADAIGKKLTTFVAQVQQRSLRMLLADAQAGPAQQHITLQAANGTPVSVLAAANLLTADASTSICLVMSDLTELEAQASSIQHLRDQQQALEESRAELEAANISLSDSRRAALNVAEDALVARRQAEVANAELQVEAAERKRAEEELKKLNEELEKRVAERTKELAANVEKLKIETDERVQAVETLREKEQMLIQQSRQAAMGEMIGNIAHQWRQPLNTLGLTVQQLLLYYDMDGFTREFLETSVDKSMELIQHMSRTIDDFRNFFRPDKEKVTFELGEAIAHTLSLVEDSFKKDHIRIKFIAKNDPVIIGYRNEFAQVILNILNNARDIFTERKTKDPKVSISIFTEEERAVVTIADNGGGIPEEIMGKVFDPYFTTKGPQHGTGVGLFMSKAIIESNMGGRLSARNIGHGAEFRIEV